MIKVTIKKESKDEGGNWLLAYEIKEHKKGMQASVHNGILSIFSSSQETSAAIAGYRGDIWISYEVVEQAADQNGKDVKFLQNL